VLNQKAQAWWDASPNELGAALKTSFKLPEQPAKEPPHGRRMGTVPRRETAEVEHLTRALADAEAEINADEYRALLEAIWQWSQDASKERIERDDVERLLGSRLTIPGNQFQLPDNRVDRPEAHEELARRIECLQSGYIVVLGSPGCGKSTLLNTLRSGSTIHDRNDVIIYNCFTGTSDSFLRTRALADNFVRFLARELYQLYPKDLVQLLNVDAASVESLLAKASGCLAVPRKLVLVVDGLDYAKRFATDYQPSVFDSLPPVPPDRVVIVVSEPSATDRQIADFGGSATGQTENPSALDALTASSACSI
jgi:archaellum biogenesis ATPase FlaH